MIEPVQVLWSPAGTSMPSLGDRALVDVTDGDTPNIRMPIRMLSVDTPEVTAKTPVGAATVDDKFAQLAEWIHQGKAPISAGLAAYLHPRPAARTCATANCTARRTTWTSRRSTGCGSAGGRRRGGGPAQPRPRTGARRGGLTGGRRLVNTQFCVGPRHQLRK